MYNFFYYYYFQDTLFGECEAAYVIAHHPHDRRSSNIINVTKVRNFGKYKRRPSQSYSVRYGHRCGEAYHEKTVSQQNICVYKVQYKKIIYLLKLLHLWRIKIAIHQVFEKLRT